MAESIVNVTEGSGKKLHTFNRTIGANSVEDEVVLLGENYLASYTGAPFANIPTGTLDTHLIELMAGSSLKLRIRRIEVYQTVAATTASMMAIGLWRLTTAGTGGSSFTLNPTDPSDPAVGATARHSLTSLKGTEGALLWVGKMYLFQTLATGTPIASPVLVWDFDRPRSKPIIVAAGTSNGIAIKSMDAVAGASVSISILFDETNF